MAKRKKYITVKVPILRDELRVLGTPEDLNNKTIKLDMTRRMRGKGLNITFRILNKEGNLYAFPNKLDLVKSYIRRMMRKRTDYVEDSFKTKAKDVEIIIKPLLITRKRVSRVVRKNLRNTAKEFLIEYIKERNYNELCIELMSGEMQRAMLPKLKKVYPLSFCDIRVFETKYINEINFEEIISIEEEKTKEVEVEKENTDKEEKIEEKKEKEEEKINGEEEEIKEKEEEKIKEKEEEDTDKEENNEEEEVKKENTDKEEKIEEKKKTTKKAVKKK